MEEPFGMRPEEIARLTDAQIVGLYGRERDAKTGIPKKVETKRERERREMQFKREKSQEQLRREAVELFKMFGVSQADAEKKAAEVTIGAK